MSQTFSDFDFSALNTTEKLNLIGRIWESLAETPTPSWHVEVLDERLASADASPESAIPWEAVKKRLENPS